MVSLMLRHIIKYYYFADIGFILIREWYYISIKLMHIRISEFCHNHIELKHYINMYIDSFNAETIHIQYIHK